MKFTLIIFIIVFIACNSSSLSVRNKIIKEQEDVSDKILWSSNRKLTWNDFKGNPREDRGTIRAETSGEIVTEKSYWESGIPKFEIRCYFLKNKSWTVANDSLTLEHEQIHFDIYELFTRKIRKSFDSLNDKKETDFQIYEKIFNRFLIENETYNNEYDDQVRFDRLAQRQWIDNVFKELNRLKRYEYISKD